MTEYAIELGDVIEVLRGYRDNSFDAVLCDPPYGLSFMGKRWDYDVPGAELWREVLRVCKPGAALVAFSGTRTYHRAVVQIEDAGWEIRDCLAWMYGSGFPKSLDVSKAIDKAAGAEREVVGEDPEAARRNKATSKFSNLYGEIADAPSCPRTAPATEAARLWQGYGTALKPAFEPAVLARKPLEGTVAESVARWGVGALAIDACRIGTEGGGTHCTNRDESGKCRGHQNAGRSTSGETFHGPDAGAPLGRWPANALLDEEAGAILDAQSGNRPSTPYPANDAKGAVLPLTHRTAGGYSDSGGASRFFYCPKANRKERDLGCESLPLRSGGDMTDREDGTDGLNSPRAGAGRTGGARNHHPTVKPIALMEYLARLIMPPNPGAILVPFSGSGSEMIGALKAGWPAVLGIERESEYVEIARARLKHHTRAAA